MQLYTGTDIGLAAYMAVETQVLCLGLWASRSIDENNKVQSDMLNSNPIQLIQIIGPNIIGVTGPYPQSVHL